MNRTQITIRQGLCKVLGKQKKIIQFSWLKCCKNDRQSIPV